MDAITDPEPTDPDEAVRAAQDALLSVEKMAVLVNDPIKEPLKALRAFLTAFASTATLHRMTTKRDTLAIEAVQRSLQESMNRAVTAARADVEKAHAEMARNLVGTISSRASAELGAMSRAIWRRNVILASALPIVALLIGAVAGYWRGYQVGHYDAASTIRSSTPLDNQIIAAEGTAGLADWQALMRENAIKPLMAGCHGKKLIHERGRAACWMLLWVTPYVQSEPDAKK